MQPAAPESARGSSSAPAKERTDGTRRLSRRGFLRAIPEREASDFTKGHGWPFLFSGQGHE